MQCTHTHHIHAHSSPMYTHSCDTKQKEGNTRSITNANIIAMDFHVTDVIQWRQTGAVVLIKVVSSAAPLAIPPPSINRAFISATSIFICTGYTDFGSHAFPPSMCLLYVCTSRKYMCTEMLCVCVCVLCFVSGFARKKVLAVRLVFIMIYFCVCREGDPNGEGDDACYAICEIINLIVDINKYLFK